MSPQLAQSLLNFMLSYAIASIPGLLSYVFGRAFQNQNLPTPLSRGCFSVGVEVGLWLFLAAIVSEFFASFIPAVVMTMVCLTGAVAEKAIRREDETLFHYFVFLTATTFFSGIFSFIVFGLIIISNLRIGVLPWFDSSGYYFGLLITPSVVPYLIWIWRSLQLRPGIDKNLND